jgi:hypothetical protein
MFAATSHTSPWIAFDGKADRASGSWCRSTTSSLASSSTDSAHMAESLLQSPRLEYLLENAP